MSWKDHRLADEAALREVIPASGISTHKVLDHIDEHCRRFIHHATLALIATWDAHGRADVSRSPGLITVSLPLVFRPHRCGRSPGAPWPSVGNFS